MHAHGGHPGSTMDAPATAAPCADGPCGDCDEFMTLCPEGMERTAGTDRLARSLTAGTAELEPGEDSFALAGLAAGPPLRPHRVLSRHHDTGRTDLRPESPVQRRDRLIE